MLSGVLDQSFYRSFAPKARGGKLIVGAYCERAHKTEAFHSHKKKKKKKYPQTHPPPYFDKARV